MDDELLQIVGISLGLGLLVGLQRQYNNAHIAGIRTFPLVTLFGTLAALLATDFGGWVLAAGALAVAALVVVAILIKSQEQHIHAGLTTAAALLLMYALGAYLVTGNRTVAVALGGTIAVLLHFKAPLHRLASGFGEKDIMAIMQFVLISLVIFPVLPNATYGPYDVLNPHSIWLMVVLIVGIGLVGYFAYKILGQRAGTFLAGILGGMISSTATAVSYARKVKSNTTLVRPASFIIFTASTVAFIRIITEIIIVSPSAIPEVLPPLGTVFLLMLFVVIVLYFVKKPVNGQMPEQGNPAQLKSALAFGAVYGLVVLATAFAKDKLGESGLYAVAIFSGLTNVDAITLSTAQLMQQGGLDTHNGWQIILTAALSNLVFKGGIVAVLGGRRLFLHIALLFGIAIAGGLLVLWLWPEQLTF